LVYWQGLGVPLR